jgi:putative ABC transport system substrate-binding protein
MKRRAFMAGLGGTAAWPVVGRAQQSERMRRVGVLMGSTGTHPESRAHVGAFRYFLAALGWNENSNLILDVRWSAGDATLAGSLAKTLVAQKPDVILTETTPPTEAVLRETNSIPIVFAVVSDPVGSGFVKSLQRPGGNATGFMDLESTFAKKWVELLKEIAPNTQKAAVMFNPQTATYVDYYLRPMRDVGGETWREAIN